jgi:hypothetical protein
VLTALPTHVVFILQEAINSKEKFLCTASLSCGCSCTIPSLAMQNEVLISTHAPYHLTPTAMFTLDLGTATYTVIQSCTS